MKGGLGEAVMYKRDIFTMGSPSGSTCSSLPHHVCGVMGKVQLTAGYQGRYPLALDEEFNKGISWF